MGRAVVAVLAALLVLGAGSARAAEKPLLLKPAIPPRLAELEAKADALQITSTRVALSTSLHLQHESKAVRQFAKLLELKIEGVETTSPAAAAIEAKFFGTQVRLRYVEGHLYTFSWALGKHDGGRPWVELGHGLLGRSLGNTGKKPPTGPVSGAARFGKIFTLVNDGIGLHEVPATTLYGQPVTGFEEELEQKAASEGISSSGVSTGVAAAERPAPLAAGVAAAESSVPLATGSTAAKRPSPAQAPKPKLTIYFAASGAPVRVQIVSGTGKVGVVVTIDFPAIDFPYTIPAPPPSHVISEAALLKRMRHGRNSPRAPLLPGGEGPSEESSKAETVTPGSGSPGHRQSKQ